MVIRLGGDKGKAIWARDLGGQARKTIRITTTTATNLSELIPILGLSRCWIPGIYQISSPCRKQIRK